MLPLRALETETQIGKISPTSIKMKLSRQVRLCNTPFTVTILIHLEVVSNQNLLLQASMLQKPRNTEENQHLLRKVWASLKNQRLLRKIRMHTKRRVHRQAGAFKSSLSQVRPELWRKAKKIQMQESSSCRPIKSLSTLMISQAKCSLVSIVNSHSTSKSKWNRTKTSTITDSTLLQQISTLLIFLLSKPKTRF